MRAERLCTALEEFRAICPTSAIDFERVIILNPQVHWIERKHLPMLVHRNGVRRSTEFSSLQSAREAYEREYILKKIDDCNGNISRAAEALGLERSHLYRKMRTLGISARES